MSTLPIIRIEIEGMRSAILAALTERQIEMDAYVKDSLDRFLAGHALQEQIDRHVSVAIDTAIKQEADRYFLYGDGRKFIAQAVAARLNDEAPR